MLSSKVLIDLSIGLETLGVIVASYNLNYFKELAIHTDTNRLNGKYKKVFYKELLHYFNLTSISIMVAIVGTVLAFDTCRDALIASGTPINLALEKSYGLAKMSCFIGVGEFFIAKAVYWLWCFVNSVDVNTKVVDIAKYNDGDAYLLYSVPLHGREKLVTWSLTSRAFSSIKENKDLFIGDICKRRYCNSTGRFVRPLAFPAISSVFGIILVVQAYLVLTSLIV